MNKLKGKINEISIRSKNRAEGEKSRNRIYKSRSNNGRVRSKQRPGKHVNRFG